MAKTNINHALIMLTTLALVPGCRAFEHYVYIGDAAYPEVDGTWTGQVVPVELYDGNGRSLSQAAGIQIAAGHTTFVQDSGISVTPPYPIHSTVLLSRDGKCAIAYSEFTPNSWIEVTGTLYPNGRYPLKEPQGKIWVDQTPGHGVAFLQGRPKLIAAPATTPSN